MTKRPPDFVRNGLILRAVDVVPPPVRPADCVEVNALFFVGDAVDVAKAFYMSPGDGGDDADLR